MSDVQTPPAEAAASTPAAPSALDELRSTVAAHAGLPEGFASRLQGATLGELLTDARSLAATLAPAPAAAAPAASPTAAEPAAPTSTADLSGAQLYALEAAGLITGVTPGFRDGIRREQPQGMTREQIAELAKRNPTEFNRRLEAGEIDLRRIV